MKKQLGFAVVEAAIWAAVLMGIVLATVSVTQKV